MTGRFLTAALVAVSIGLLGLGSRDVAAQGGCTSPFPIALDPAIASWTSDFPRRRATIDADTSPPQADRDLPPTSYADRPFGPLNPQLSSSGSIGPPAAAASLKADRVEPVPNVIMNAVPAGVDPTGWQRQRILAAADVLLQAGTPPARANAARHLPPPGVHILPFTDSDWLYQDFRVAMPEPATVVLAVLGMVVVGAWRARRSRRGACCRQDAGLPRREAAAVAQVLVRHGLDSAAEDRGMRIRLGAFHRRAPRAIAFILLAAPAPCWGQVASPSVRKHDSAVQERPGEGDQGESEGIDEAAGAKPHDGPYRSPYTLTFKAPLHDLLFDADQPRGSPKEQSTVPFREWYTAKVRHEWGSWGVPARRFECPAHVTQKSAEWRRERVVAAAGRFIGHQYQHHHVPDWSPPAGWPWKRCCAGHNGPGIDCSNFSGWNYNWALGIHLNTDIHKQAAAKSVRSSQGDLHAHVIERPEGRSQDWYDNLVRQLRAGDLLYISNKSRTKVSHVIMWVGECGSGGDGTPLVIDSTGGRIKDSNGHAIPCGVHLRPFKKGSWYHESFNHAHRWVR